MKYYLALVLLLIAPSLINANNFADISDLNDFMGGYYKNPKPELIADAIEIIGKENDLKPNMIPPIIGFFNRVFHDNIAFKKQWKDEIDKQNNKVKRILLFTMDTSPELILKKIKPSPSANDFCWGSYSASGDTKYLEMLLKNTSYVSENKNINLYFTSWSAKWSLCSFTKTDQNVKLFLTDKLKTDNNPIIKEILNQDPGEIREKLYNDI